MAGISAAIPYLCVKDAASALAFYERAFGAVVTREPVMFEGKIGHAELRLDNVQLFVADEFPEFGVRSPASVGACTATIVLIVSDVRGLTERAREAGATVTQEPKDEPYGQTAKLQDPFGQRWIVNSG